LHITVFLNSVLLHSWFLVRSGSWHLKRSEIQKAFMETFRGTLLKGLQESLLDFRTWP